MRYAVEIRTKEELSFLANSDGDPRVRVFPSWDRVQEEDTPCLYFSETHEYEGWDGFRDIYNEDKHTFHVLASVYIETRDTIHFPPKVGEYWLFEKGNERNEIYYICGKTTDGCFVLQYQVGSYNGSYEVIIDRGKCLTRKVDGFFDLPARQVFTGSSLVEDFDNLLGEE